MARKRTIIPGVDNKLLIKDAAKLIPEPSRRLFLTGAASLGAGAVEIGLFADTLIASFLPRGDLTALYYADRINQLPMGIVGVALGTVVALGTGPLFTGLIEWRWSRRAPATS